VSTVTGDGQPRIVACCRADRGGRRAAGPSPQMHCALRCRGHATLALGLAHGTQMAGRPATFSRQVHGGHGHVGCRARAGRSGAGARGPGLARACRLPARAVSRAIDLEDAVASSAAAATAGSRDRSIDGPNGRQRIELEVLLAASGPPKPKASSRAVHENATICMHMLCCYLLTSCWLPFEELE
jgi:hypothetical protein